MTLIIDDILILTVLENLGIVFKKGKRSHVTKRSH